jgi:diguanylate cyclase (GGDEF)-like protein
MFWLQSRFRLWPVLLTGIVLSALLQPIYAATLINDSASFLDQAESLRTTDHPRFVQMLQQIHHEARDLTPEERWHLRYLDAWEIMFEGDYAKSEAQLHDVINHAKNAALVTKASALLLTNLGNTRRYEEAFALANQLAANLPSITDPQARFMLLLNLSQMLDFAGQTGLAVKYAHMMEGAVPPGETLCRPLSLQAAALFNAKHLTSSSPELQKAIDTCVAAQQPIYANAMWLILSSLYLDENQPAKAMTLLDRIAPSIHINQYYPHVLSSQVQRAQAYAKLGNDGSARTAALAAIAMSGPNDINEWLKDDYEVLYQVDKRQGHLADALADYEHYVIQDKGHLNDISARTLAYAVAQQQTLVQNLETESLNKQNNILRLQQELATKAVETSRLYIALLLVVLVSIVFWLFRLKRSQLRFKQLSCLDGLTGILNHQHFVCEAERSLRLQEKKSGSACLVSIDLDYFKQVNDTHGHAIGDAVLKHTVTICKQHLRACDLFGRLGGEEFGILLVDCSRDQGMAIADRIRMAIGATPIDIDGCRVSFSASLGLACTDMCGYDLQRLCREADAALYRAKRNGRNRVIADVGNGNLAQA